jgi:hypothetical protein
VASGGDVWTSGGYRSADGMLLPRQPKTEVEAFRR